MNNAIITRSQIVEAQIITTAAGTIAQFEDVPNLSKNNIEVYAIEAMTATQVSVSPKGRAVIPAAAAPSLTVDLIDSQNVKLIEGLPYFNLVRSNNSGFIYLLANLKLNLTSCRVRVNTATGLTANQVALFNIYYREI